MNGHSVGVKRNAPRQGPSLVGRLFSIIASAHMTSTLNSG
ncbi:hypothetical protein HYQ46_013280 [Verticillium longisporum]|nr:hypothetical protein HYQ46_013280 [Verticillium longisporum]